MTAVSLSTSVKGGATGVLLPRHPRQASTACKAKAHHTASGSHSRIIVQHNYHDHSQEPPPPPAVVVTTDLESSVSAVAGASSPSSSASSNSAAFPIRLHTMLTHAAEDGIALIVSFAPHGRALQIHDPEAFKRLLPHYFTLSKIASFQRQLNLYGFNRLTRGADRGCYYHELFLRGMPWLMARMTRVKVKGTGVRARSNPEQEPDLYALPWVGMVPSVEAEDHERAHGRPSIPSTGPETVPSPPQPVPSVTRILATETSAVVERLHSSVSSAIPAPTKIPSSLPPTPVATQSMSSVVSQTASSSSSSSSGSRGSASSTSSCSSPSSSSEGRESGDDFEMEDAELDDAADDDGDLVLSGWGMPFHYLGKLDAVPPSVDVLPVTNPAGGVDARIPGRPLKRPGMLQLLQFPFPNAVPAVPRRFDVDRELEQALYVLLDGEYEDDSCCGLYESLPF